MLAERLNERRAQQLGVAGGFEQVVKAFLQLLGWQGSQAQTAANAAGNGQEVRFGQPFVWPGYRPKGQGFLLFVTPCPERLEHNRFGTQWPLHCRPKNPGQINYEPHHAGIYRTERKGLVRKPN